MSPLTLVAFFGVLVVAFAQNLNYLELRQLYNTRVTEAEKYRRPLQSGRRKRSTGLHVGVVVTTVTGERWLIHKGKSYGDASEAVVVRASSMSSRWTRVACGTVRGYTVGDFVGAADGECRYNLITCNCWDAAKAMWKLVSETSCDDDDDSNGGWWSWKGK